MPQETAGQLDGQEMPLPPIPIPTPPVPATQRGELVRLLSELNEAHGGIMALWLLPGDIPALQIPPDHLVEMCGELRDHLGFDMLSSISGVDMAGFLEVVYHLRSLPHQWLLEVKVKVPASGEVPTVVGLWPGADPLERETFDLFGIRFVGHPDLRRILLDDEFEGYPLLKSFNQTPIVRHDRATTQTNPVQAVRGASEHGLGPQRAESALLNQGEQERLHPGTPSLGDTQFHGRWFPPETWLHRPPQDQGGEDQSNATEAAQS